ncbi:HupE / UreJ protein [Flavobacterium fluvii]|uniref:HupE / UreJ protein n=1 Tax=Flavobacterium fluvii TaxID=468056 RepID=A0A1M5JXP3_9FLAO|nr:HupE/UreJ family protein [Flavobacterium fluvii]SHG45326.1 HupE / UreJ protein [Flavobacterium fluvii]
MCKNKIIGLFVLLFFLGKGSAMAHALPDSKAQLIVEKEQILIKFSTPLEIVEKAYKKPVLLQSSMELDNLKHYYLKHILVTDSLRSSWNVSVGSILINENEVPVVGKYKQVIASIYLNPSNSNSLRNFDLSCDIIIHQIPTQSILFSVDQDWQKGIVPENSKQIGVIAFDSQTGTIRPLKIQLGHGTWFAGFKSMVKLGMQHIKEGTDHLLFLLVLLLPATLVVNRKKWGGFGGVKYSIVGLLKIVTAFTIGHSITLLIGALGWLHLPSELVEVLIAFSILISAIHAIYPLFPGKEVYVAAGFGLIHGLAFASILVNLNLDTSEMVLSILSFNIGIELMQLFVIGITVPWIILLSKSSTYNYVRNLLAVLAGIAALAWISERITGHSNWIAVFILISTQYAPYIIGMLAITALIINVGQRIKLKKR